MWVFVFFLLLCVTGPQFLGYSPPHAQFVATFAWQSTRERVCVAPRTVWAESLLFTIYTNTKNPHISYATRYIAVQPLAHPHTTPMQLLYSPCTTPPPTQPLYNRFQVLTNACTTLSATLIQLLDSFYTHPMRHLYLLYTAPVHWTHVLSPRPEVTVAHVSCRAQLISGCMVRGELGSSGCHTQRQHSVARRETRPDIEP
mmetsp:Transcript_32004/g.53832  ORF Transcript_32004/g.53832 Transcript_32004/m.53832 type:complete len:200 (-) Transcript_32004:193-792(-)